MSFVERLSVCQRFIVYVTPTESGLCVVTGGDDNGITVSRLCVETTPLLSVTLEVQYTHPNAHSSSITGTPNHWIKLLSA